MVLSPFLISILALHLPKLCEYLTRFELYKCNEMSFRVQTLTEYSARIALDRTPITLKLPKLEYMLLSVTMLANQLARYKLPEANLSTHVQSATGATAFVPHTEQACHYVQYDVFFEDINRDVQPCVCAPHNII